MILSIFKKIIYLILFIVFILWSVPKTNLYYWLEHQLTSYNIVIDGEQTKENLFSFVITDANIYHNKSLLLIANEIHLSLTVNPSIINIVGDSKLGNIYGNINLIEKKITLYLQPNNKFDMPQIDYLKKEKSGEYKYEFQI